MAGKSRAHRMTAGQRLGRLWSGLVRLGLGIFILVHVYALILIWAPVPGTVTMVQSVVAGAGLRRGWTPLEEVSPHLVRAVIAAEDTGFCQHAGIDPDAIRQALTERRATGRVRGASTLSQQTAKNVFLWNGGGWIRKAPETWLALVTDFAWGKRRVMEIYLNIAEWGDGRFGAEAAAQYYFGKRAAELTATEAARLAAVLPNPNVWRAQPAGPYVRQRTATLLARMTVVRRDGLEACVLGAG